jgi:hypothetical protein
MRLELAFLLAQFLSLAFQSNCVVHQCLEVWISVALQLIIERPNQTIQKPFLSLTDIIHLIRCLTRQMSELVQVLGHRHASLPRDKNSLCLSLITPEGM